MKSLTENKKPVRPGRPNRSTYDKTGKEYIITGNLFPGLNKSSKKSASKKVYYANSALDQSERQMVSAALRAKGQALATSIYHEENKRGLSILKEADRFCRCGFCRLWQCEWDRQIFKVHTSCHSRICGNCGNAYKYKIIQSVEDMLKPCYSKKRRGWGVFLLTLTTQVGRYRSDSPGRPDIKRLYAESSKLLRLFFGRYKCRMTDKDEVIEDALRYRTVRNYDGTKIKKKRLPKYRINSKGKQVEDYRTWRGSGYIASMEMGKKNNMLHIHAVVYSPYKSKKKMSEMWHKITGDSYIIDFKPIEKLKGAVWYVFKYIIKPPETDSFMTLADYVVAIKGSRRLRTGGIFYNVLKKAEQIKIDFSCPYCKRRLVDIGEIDFEPGYPELYALLREANQRGSPLKYPDSYDGSDPFLRSWAATLGEWSRDPSLIPKDFQI